MKARVVRKTEITKYKNEDWADLSRRVFCQGDTAYIPVKDGYHYDIELEERKPYRGIGYQKLSDTILIHGCTPTEEELSKILEWEKPSCILHIKSSCGVMRIPDAEVLYGTPHDVTFKESGILYTMNPAKVMFSQGNRNEKLRIRRCVSSHERVADMFAG
ncbi:MAG TPA: SAM-dependent methyltransferase, partial [Methanocorpusculum sp.]|nr:SAM-dependent methyltransferase [Methanocorpusculum sp.]